MKLSCHDRSDRVWYVIKIRKDNDMTDHRDVVQPKNKTELSWSIEQSAIYDENRIEQLYY